MGTRNGRLAALLLVMHAPRPQFSGRSGLASDATLLGAAPVVPPALAPGAPT